MCVRLRLTRRDLDLGFGESVVGNFGPYTFVCPCEVQFIIVPIFPKLVNTFRIKLPRLSRAELI